MIHLCGVNSIEILCAKTLQVAYKSYTFGRIYSNSNMSRGSSSLVRSLQTDNFFKYYSYGLYIGPPHAMMKRMRIICHHPHISASPHRNTCATSAIVHRRIKLNIATSAIPHVDQIRHVTSIV